VDGASGRGDLATSGPLSPQALGGSGQMNVVFADDCGRRPQLDDGDRAHREPFIRSGADSFALRTV